MNNDRPPKAKTVGIKVGLENASNGSDGNKREGLGWMTGFEPATSGSTIRRSNQLSYTHRAGAEGKTEEIGS